MTSDTPLDILTAELDCFVVVETRSRIEVKICDCSLVQTLDTIALRFDTFFCVFSQIY